MSSQCSLLISSLSNGDKKGVTTAFGEMYQWKIDIIKFTLRFSTVDCLYRLSLINWI